MGRLWDLIEEHRATSDYPPSYRQIAMRADVNPSTFMKWKVIKELPERENLHALARAIGMPYDKVLTAALIDIAYIADPDLSDPDVTLPLAADDSPDESREVEAQQDEP